MGAAGDGASLVLVAVQKKTLALQASEFEPTRSTSVEPAVPPVGKRLLAECVATYIAEITAHKSTKTAQLALRACANCGQYLNKNGKSWRIWELKNRGDLTFEENLRSRQAVYRVWTALETVRVPLVLTGGSL